MDILLATTNAGKIRDFEILLSGFSINWLSLKDFPETEEVEEDGKTFAENAARKAIGYARQTGILTLADDSGLEIDALGGEPGINSARFSGAHKDHSSDAFRIDEENIKKVLRLMEDVPEENRSARFVSSLCLADSEKPILEAEGFLPGMILREKRGSGGFGYDPIFYLPERGKSVAELEREEKNKISHRANAVKNLRPMLKEFLRRGSL
ncbi:RdgB/HAM1 family non-canonical purine NTP pyrophosphatase [Sedimentisphaera salicampi]|uniref:RdgB/HAM1 family non-canonical purine NTP pyrophosphatase n=1 Tax=Sedimentisphaera salicampi TaxID=1941349 RepID=UPI000B9BEDB7|nr:RdgB/HAM1 family non-canonical purine NTP pyrophosphatase [Sedimentisphaera salicampi]OXU15106.1 dITP/XTP pyrophosphatase [Sedimentisphaera salicampi]